MPTANKILNLPDLLRGVGNINFSDTPIADSGARNYPQSTNVTDLYLPQLPPPPNAINLAEKNDEMFKAGLGRSWDLIKGILPYNPDTGEANVDLAGPVMVGKAGARNAKKILEQIAESGATRNVDIGQEFFKRKYPKIAGLVDDIFAAKENYPYAGGYNPIDNTIAVRNQGIKQNIWDYINTLSHEGTHATQVKIPRNLEKYIKSQKEFADKMRVKGVPVWDTGNQFDYLHPNYETGPQEVKDWFKGLSPEDQKLETTIRTQKYQQQPVEATAIQGGKTGETAYKNFIDQIIPDKQPFHFNAELDESNKRLAKDLIENEYRNKFISNIDNLDKYKKLMKEMEEQHKMIDEVVKHQSALRKKGIKPEDPLQIRDFMSNESKFGELLGNVKAHGYTSIIDPTNPSGRRWNIGDIAEKMYDLDKETPVYKKTIPVRTKIRNPK